MGGCFAFRKRNKGILVYTWKDFMIISLSEEINITKELTEENYGEFLAALYLHQKKINHMLCE